MSVLQVVGAYFLSIGTFEESARALPVFIQPAGWAFSVWGLIYTLSFVYAVYQVIPKNNNPTLQATRLPALIAFVGSTAWLYFAGLSNAWVWATVLILFGIAHALTFVVKAPDADSKVTNLLSKKILYPYAAWTAIAAWLNPAALLVERGVVTSETLNFTLNLLLFGAILTVTLYFFKKSSYSAWYGGVLLWAATGVAAANWSSGSTTFVSLAAVYALLVVIACSRSKLQ